MSEEEGQKQSFFSLLADNFKSAIEVYKGFNTANIPAYLGYTVIVAIAAFILSQVSNQILSLMHLESGMGPHMSFYEMAIMSTFSAFHQSIPILAIGLFALMLKGESLKEGINLSGLFSNLNATMWQNVGISLAILFVCSFFVPGYYGFGWEDINGFANGNLMKRFFYHLIWILYAILPYYLAAVCFQAGSSRFNFLAGFKNRKVMAGLLIVIAIHYLGSSLINQTSELLGSLVKGISGNRSMGNGIESILIFVLGIIVLPAEARALGQGKEKPKDLDDEFLDSEVIDDVL